MKSYIYYIFSPSKCLLWSKTTSYKWSSLLDGLCVSDSNLATDQITTQSLSLLFNRQSQFYMYLALGDC